MDKDNCPDCSARLVDSEENRTSIKIISGGGKTLSRLVGTRYKYACSAVVLQNEDYPDGTLEVPCGGPPVYS